MSKKMAVTVLSVPTKGKPITKPVTLAADATVGDALKAAGFNPTNRTIILDGAVVSLETRLEPGVTITSHERKLGSRQPPAPTTTPREPEPELRPHRVEMHERPAGS